MEVEFGDLICKYSSNFNSIRWKLRILEIAPKLLIVCWPMFTFLFMLSLKKFWWLDFVTRYSNLFKFQVNQMKTESFRNSTKLLTFGLCWPFHLKTNRQLTFDQLYHFLKIGLKLWLEGDWHIDRERERETELRTRPSNILCLRIFNFASYKQGTGNQW